MHNHVTAVLCLAVMTLLPAGAHSQGALKTAAGIKVGKGRLHPSVTLSSHYQKNPGRLDSGGSNDAIVSVQPGFELEYPTRLLKVDASLDAGYYRYLGIENESTTQLSAFRGTAELGMTTREESKVPITIRASVNRSDEPGNQTETKRLIHTLFGAGTEVGFAPGGGALVTTAGYDALYDYYDDSNTNYVLNAPSLNHWRHQPMLRATWKFLPETAVLLEGRGDLTRFDRLTDPTNGNTIQNSNSDGYKIFAGLSGALTARTTLTLKAGYADSQTHRGGDFESFAGLLQGEYVFSSKTRVRLSVERDVHPTSLFRWVAINRATVGYKQTFGLRLAIDLRIDASIFEYGKPLESLPKRQDQELAGKVHVEYRISDWLSINVSNRFAVRESDFQTLNGEASFTTNLTTLSVTARY